MWIASQGVLDRVATGSMLAAGSWERPMSNRRSRLLVAALAPLVLIAIASWYDGTLLRDLRQTASATFDSGGLVFAMSIAHLLTVAGAVTVVGLSLWAHSRALGVAYALAGALLLFAASLAMVFATSVNGAPPIAPEPVVRFLGDLWDLAVPGQTGAVQTIAAAAVLAGVVEIGRSVTREGKAPAGLGPDPRLAPR
jgi:hypothetical protein